MSMLEPESREQFIARQRAALIQIVVFGAVMLAFAFAEVMVWSGAWDWVLDWITDQGIL